MKNGNREQEIASISRALKGLAKELNIPIIALAQMSRAMETRGSKRPQLSDLRESGSLEQDADMVIFLNRPEVHDKEAKDENGNSMIGKADLIIAKHRNGNLADMILKFEGKYTRFSDDREGYDTGPAGGFHTALPAVAGKMGNEFEMPANTITLGSKVNDRPKPSSSISDDDIPF